VNTKKYIYLLFIFMFVACCQSIAQQKATINGYVKEEGSQESLPGVNVYIADKHLGTSTNAYGFYSLSLPRQDTIELSFSFVGYQRHDIKLVLKQDIRLDIELVVSKFNLQEVVIEAKPEKSSETERMSVVSIPIKQIKKMPALMSIKDPLKTLQLMPGVQSAREGSAGLYVRGGGADQNLLILDDAVVYNAFHLFGFFSTFNGDALKSIELTKGGFPARYGGRLSSVVEMQMKDGNMNETHGEFGVGLLASRLTIEGPVKKGKSSFMLSGRRSYFDILTYPLIPKDERNNIYFYDFNAKINTIINDKNRIYLSGYFGKDAFKFKFIDNQESRKNGFQWGNATGTFRWNHLFNPKLFLNSSLIFTNYKFKVFDKSKFKNDRFELEYSSAIRDFTIKTDLDFFYTPKYSFKLGLLLTAHRFKPSATVFKNTLIDSVNTKKNITDAIESGAYIEALLKPAHNIRVNAGLRYGSFYVANRYYGNIEPRISIAFTMEKNWAAKASFAKMNQYIHLLSNSGIGLPTDLWVPATPKIAPKCSWQAAVGLVKDFTNSNIAFTLEGFYKKMSNIVAYKDGASFLVLNDDPEGIETIDWQDNVVIGQGWSYGMELLLQKKTGRLSGWVGYTLSWTQHQFDKINAGKKFFARYDRRHDVSLVAIYELNPKTTASATWVYGTGNALTLPTHDFNLNGHVLNSNSFSTGSSFQGFGNRNDFRAAPYHRLDLSIQFHKKKKKNRERTWEISIYNAYSRVNPFFYTTSQKPAKGGYDYKLSYVGLFPILPSVSYNLTF